MEYEKGTFVKDAKGVGEVTNTDDHGVYVWSATTGQNAYIFLADIQPATKEEFDTAVAQRINPKKPATKPVATTQQKSPVPQPAKKTFRWTCLECGKKYNGRICPVCDGEDRMLNVDKDGDPSYGLFGGASEPRFPRDDV